MACVATQSGRRIGYVEKGGGDAAPIVFLHGVGSDKTVWEPQIDAFGRSRRAIAFDYPGYGESDPMAGASRDDFASAMLDAMEGLGVRRAHVCGLSLGGVVAIAMHAAARERCASLILSDSFAVHPEGKAIFDRSVAASSSGSMRELAEARVNALLAPGADADLRSRVVETMAAIAPEAYRAGAAAVWLADQRERASQIAVPTLVLCGALDRVTPPALSEALAAMIGGARLELIDGAGHLANVEQPAAFNACIGTFLEGLG